MAESCDSYDPSRDGELYFGLGMVERRTDEQNDAWAALNRVLDDNGGKDSPEYREAWARWERAIQANRSEA